MKLCDEYTALNEYQFASVVAHGIGVETWRDSYGWCSDFIAVENFRVPTDTLTSFKDQAWFAERHYYSPGELSRKVFGKHSDKRWKKDIVAKMLHEYDDINYDQTQGNWLTNPEKRQEMWKENDGYFSSDAVPTIALWHFFYYDDSDPSDCFWKLCVVPDWADNAPRGLAQPEFLYDSGDKPFAREISQIISVQIGDLNTKAPFHIASIRSLGFELY